VAVVLADLLLERVGPEVLKRQVSGSSFGGALSTSVGKTVSLWDSKQKLLFVVVDRCSPTCATPRARRSSTRSPPQSRGPTS
jgi:hypothetical protein